jgi:hypothetical protein
VRGLQEARESNKMLENEKCWKNPSIYEYNIMRCTVSYWVLGEHGNREWVSNRGKEVNLIKAQHTHAWSTKTTPSLDYQYILSLKIWKAGWKNKCFLGEGTNRKRVGSRKGGMRGEYGRWILLSIYENRNMKLLKLF